MRDQLRQMRIALDNLSIRRENKVEPAVVEPDAKQERRFARSGGPSLSPDVRQFLMPWLAGPIEYADRYGTLAQEAKRWRLGFFVAVVALLASVAGLVAIATSVKVIPYVVQVDKHGYAVTIGPAEKAAPVDERVILFTVMNFIRGLRTVVADPIAQRGLEQDAFVLIGEGTDAANKAREHLSSRELPPEETVEVEILRAAPMKSALTLTVDWVEHHRRGGTRHHSTRYSALVSVAIHPTRLLDDISVNPLGVFVTHYAISEL